MDRTPIIRTSERRDFGRCKQRWWWAWREGLREKGTPAPPLWFGIGIHISLALWYCGPGKKRGPHPAETWTDYCGSELAFIKTQDLTEEQEARYTSAQELGRVMMQGYVDLYGRDEHKLYVSPEQTFKLKVPWTDRQQLFEYVEGAILAYYAGTFDGVWRDYDSGQLWLDEHKTAKVITLGHLPIDVQGGSYWAVAEKTLQDQGLIEATERLRGIQYNFMRKGLPDERPKDAQGYATNLPVKADYVRALTGINERTEGELLKMSQVKLAQLARANHIPIIGQRSKIQPGPLFHREDIHRTRPQRAAMLRHIQDDAVEMQVYRQRLLPLGKTSTKDCQWDCRFYEMCLLQEEGGNWEDFRDLQFKVEDPYADHRKSTDE
jgi:hypothetical protein